MDIVTGNFYRATLAASMPAGPMGIDKGQKGRSPPFIFLPNTIDVGRRACVRGWGANSEINFMNSNQVNYQQL